MSNGFNATAVEASPFGSVDDAKGAITEVYLDKYDVIVGRMDQYYGDPACDGEDFAQEAYTRAMENADKLRHNSNVAAWLKNVTLNNAYNTVKKAHLERRASDSDYDAFIDRGLAFERKLDDETFDTFEQGVAYQQDALDDLGLWELSEDRRKVVILKDVCGYTPTEIGDMYGIPAGTVNSRLNRAHRDLLKIAELGLDDEA